jgi:site-specific DNA recombinase
MERLRLYSQERGLEVVEEVEDAGHSGATLDRPGMDRVRDLVAAGGISVVLAQDRDRFAREPAYLFLLKRELAEYGTELRALNANGDDSPESELQQGILDQLAKFERAKMTERTRRGRLQRAREGKVLPVGHPPYGFAYGDDGTNYIVNEQQAAIVQEIFERIACGASVRSVERDLTQRGIPSPGGSKLWNRTTIRRIVENDVYKAHTASELQELVDEGVLSAGVLRRLDPTLRYGIQWTNTKRVELTPDGKRKRRLSPRPRSDWVALPVPDLGVNRDHLQPAREKVKNGSRSADSKSRFWELAGILYCSECSTKMNRRKVRSRGKDFYYYICNRVLSHGKDGCANNRVIPADALEKAIALRVSTILRDPDRIRRDLDEAIERARKDLRNSDATRKALADQIQECEHKRARLIDLAQDGLISKGDLAQRLEAIDADRGVAEGEMKKLEDGERHIEALTMRRKVILEAYSQKILLGVWTMPPEIRRGIYDLLGLKATASPSDENGVAHLHIELDLTPGVIRFSREVEEYITNAVAQSPPSGRALTKEEILQRTTACQNETDTGFSATSKRRAREFLRHARERGLSATLRPSRGEDIDAACGQLAAKDLRGRPAVLSR